MRKDLSLTLSFVAGVLIASGIVLLFTTEKGKEIRENIEKWLKEKGISLSKKEVDQVIEIIFSRNDQKVKNEN